MDFVIPGIKYNLQLPLKIFFIVMFLTNVYIIIEKPYLSLKVII